MHKENTNICSIIVSYNPELSNLSRLVTELSNQTDHVFIIDNSDSHEKQEACRSLSGEKCSVEILGKNFGIAFAQNKGFISAIKGGYDYLLTFDQDSRIGDYFVSNLVSDFLIASKYTNVACIGPAVVNERNGIEYHKGFKGATELTHNIYSVKSVISSGCLYRTDVFSKVGLNRSDWFIDGVEIEWCYRSRYLGQSVIQTRNVVMNHNLGGKDITIPVIGTVAIGSPKRLYYVFRNWIFAMREPSYNTKYKIKLILTIPLKFIVFSSVSPRKERVINMIKGLYDGIMKKNSKLW